ncbi:MAG TPA: PQQ-dependent sugar dehydrogenase, partial [Candidatus Limnocylindrales bacterium]|nr:PQQ-dependent sugar dehydrogenase [Candidatus Limnocylindrales bacterium]
LAAVGCGQPQGTPSGSVPGPGSPGASAGRSPTAAASGSVGPGPSVAAPAFDASRVAVDFETVAGGLAAPLAVVHAGDGSGRLFVAEQGGRIRIVRGGGLVDRPFLDIAGRVSSGGERGLLGVAFHPGFPDDPRVFVDYTDDNGDTRVSSFRVDPASPDHVDASTEQRLLFVKQPFSNHNGGAVVFGPDGYLYVSLGDGGSGGDPQGNGQSRTTLLGKILRIDIDKPSGDRAYGIPADNPYADGAGGRLPEIWLWGLRNPWRMTFDRLTGDLWIGDVGQGEWEEVDVQRAGAAGGTNFGWNRMEGSHCFSPSSGCEEPNLVLPQAEYGHDQGCTVIGGGVDRGNQSLLAGGYLFADYCSGRVWAIDSSVDGPRAPTLVAETGHSFSAFGEDEAGEMYAVDISAGTLLRVTARRR